MLDELWEDSHEYPPLAASFLRDNGASGFAGVPPHFHAKSEAICQTETDQKMSPPHRRFVKLCSMATTMYSKNLL
jgi:hypothetical protein